METLNESLSNVLLQMDEDDRVMRMKVIKGEAEWDSSAEERNQARLMVIVDEHGWPMIPMVGAEASNAAWLLVQHAPDLKFMEHCRELMENLRPGEIIPAYCLLKKQGIDDEWQAANLWHAVSGNW